MPLPNATAPESLGRTDREGGVTTLAGPGATRRHVREEASRGR